MTPLPLACKAVGLETPTDMNYLLADILSRPQMR
jgi:hypothetical protein